MIRFEVIGLPATQGSKKSFQTKGGRTVYVDDNKRLPDWRRLVQNEAQKHAPEQPIDGAVRLRLTFYLPVPKVALKKTRPFHVTKPDLGKMTRAVEDAMKGVMWRDDSQVCSHRTEKRYAYERPVGVEIAIEDLQGADGG